MTSPEHAVQRAREEAAAMRARGLYPPAPEPPASPADPARSSEALLEWALIEPDLGEVRSTRRIGAAVDALKRALLRLLAQYHVSLLGEQTRFNFHAALHVRRLEREVEELKARIVELERRSPGPPAP
jgi:hypothetical protein